ncbi:MAG: 2-phosphosulfolactate phosphatase [Prolixibacteraceae bacterium]|jgi:2-phosphosulfolactate phosphatase|nr:2-phosphosulfolactate phosphatase [Prolixibacteraceae bacterium]
MQIDILQLTEGAKRAKGTTVVIDVFRAFSTACYLMAAGAERIIPVEHVEEALVLKGQIPDAVLLGERNEKRVEGFDFGNSPTHIAALDFRDKTIIMTTSSGTKGLMNAKGAEEILSGSFVNAGAIVRYLKRTNPSTVSLVCMGYEGERPTQEDTFLAEYIRAKLLDQETIFVQMKEILRKGDGGRLLDPKNHTWSPASDFDLCLDLDRFDFVLKLIDEAGLKVLKVTKVN